MSNPGPRQILQLASAAVLAFGLGAAACIYLLIDEPDSSDRVVIVNGAAYSVPANITKQYSREVQRFGGKAALLFDDLNRWFSGLWHGKALARSVLCISVIASLALFGASRYLYPKQQADPDR